MITKREMEKRAIQPDSIRKSFPYKPNKLNFQSTFTTITNKKSQKPSKESHIKNTSTLKKKTKIKDPNFPKKIGLPPNKH